MKAARITTNTRIVKIHNNSYRRITEVRANGKLIETRTDTINYQK